MQIMQNSAETAEVSVAKERIPHAVALDRETIARRVDELGEWFHNLDLGGVRTAPNHFLGDFPNVKWKHISSAIPEDLDGATVLDIGCNGGFYCLEMKKRGAGRVLGVDVDERYLNQARFAAETLGMEIEFEKLSVYDVDRIAGQFDYVLFMGVFYHLRYPLFALDKVVEESARQTGVPDDDPRFRERARVGQELSLLEQADFRAIPIFRGCTLSRTATPTIRRTGGFRTARGRGNAAQFGTGDRGASGAGDMGVHPAERDA